MVYRQVANRRRGNINAEWRVFVSESFSRLQETQHTDTKVKTNHEKAHLPNKPLRPARQPPCLLHCAVQKPREQ